MDGALLSFADVTGKKEVHDSADVVIVGSGAAGATAARVLAAAGVEVIVLEEGAAVPTAELRSDMWTGFSRVWRDAGFQVASGRAFTPILQGSCVGGTTAINGAIIHRLPEAIHAVWQREHGLSETYSYAELSRVFDQLDRELSVGEAPDAVLGHNNRLFGEGFAGIGLSPTRIRRNVRDCQGSAHCNQGCPTARRQSMNVSYVPQAIRDGARVYTNCRATRILARSDRAAGIEARFVSERGERGPRFVTHARRAVLIAASAIQTPLLLADSGVGRASDQVGRRLQAHPGTAVVGVFDEPVRMWRGATQGYESTALWSERMKFETVAMPLELAAARLPSLGPQLMRDLADYDHLAIWGVQVRARAQGRVRRGLFGGKRIDYDLGEEDMRTLKRGITHLCEALFEAGARAVLPGVHGLPERIGSMDELAPLSSLPDDPRLVHCIAAHLFGTAVLGPSARNSVVDPQLRAHDLEGLYVIDSSVFPTNLGVNPQHSISALAWLTAERLR